MNREDKTAAIEARLERSLRRQVRAPKLDGRFDASVWSRIAAEERTAKPPLATRSRMPKWLLACNALGVGITLVLTVLYFVPALADPQVSTELSGAVPGISMPDQASLLKYASPIITALALGFGLMFTRAGRRLMSELQ